MPLVTHGGTGNSLEDMIKKAISLDVAKDNVNTECPDYLSQMLHVKYIEAG